MMSLMVAFLWMMVMSSSMVSGEDFNCSSRVPLNKDLTLKTSNTHHFSLKAKLSEEEVRVDLSSPGNVSFNGFFVTALPVEDEEDEEEETKKDLTSLGEWSIDENNEEFKVLDCGLMGSKSSFTSVSLKWVPQRSKKSSGSEGEIKFLVTVWDGKNYWRDISSKPLSLEEENDDDEDETTATTTNLETDMSIVTFASNSSSSNSLSKIWSVSSTRKPIITTPSGAPSRSTNKLKGLLLIFIYTLFILF